MACFPFYLKDRQHVFIISSKTFQMKKKPWMHILLPKKPPFNASLTQPSFPVPLVSDFII